MTKCKKEPEKIEYLCVKNLCAKNIKNKNLASENATFSTVTTSNLNVANINGTHINCFGNNSYNVSGVITPVVYKEGQPQQPENDGTFNQKVLDELWKLNNLARLVTNLESSYGRLRNSILNNFYNCNSCPTEDISNCDCPIDVYSVFQGSISGNVLTVTQIENVSLTDCPPSEGTMKIGQQVYGKTEQFLDSTIVSQTSGTTGGIGTYIIKNSFDESLNISSQEMLSLSVIGIEECTKVPLRLYGVETLSVGPLGDCNTLLSNITYNINIANRTLGSKLAAVYVQVGWQNLGSEDVQIQGLEIDTRQFDNSILSFGEQMNNTVLLSTELILQISPNNFSEITNAVAQLVVYVEDGLHVFIPESNVSTNVLNRNVNTLNTPDGTNFSTGLSTSSIPILIEGTYKIPPGATSVKLKGSGGEGGSQRMDEPIPKPAYGAGGGGEGFITIRKIPTNATSFVVTAVGGVGVSAGYFIDSNGTKIGEEFYADTGGIGFGPTGSSGGPGYSGGGGGANLQNSINGGRGITPNLNGLSSSGTNGGRGGNMGGQGGQYDGGDFYGGGGGAGFDITGVGGSGPGGDGAPLKINSKDAQGLGTGGGGGGLNGFQGKGGYVQFI